MNGPGPRSQIVSLGDIALARPRAAASAACAEDERIADHPCYSEQAHHYFARIHLPVAPACNIQCHYCNRKYDCSNEGRPGVTSRRLSPEEAVERLKRVAAAMPQLSVVGIAGPGDALANGERTFTTFDLVRKLLPEAKLCLSTNGLALPEQVPLIRDHGIDHVTITINATEPEIAQRIYAWVYYGKRRRTGLDAARILIERQLEGLDALVAAKVLVKVNSVMIPGINDHHLPALNAELKRRGAFLHNIVPLIARPEHGTAFGLAGHPEPTPQELEALRERCGGAKLMRHCGQCRADATGLLAEDRNAEFAASSEPPAEPDRQARDIYRRFVARDREARQAARLAVRRAAAGIDPTLVRTVAVATKGGDRINEHFGHARHFQVYRVSALGVVHLGIRRADRYCLGGEGDDDAWPSLFAALAGCDAVMVAKIGGGPRRRLAEAGINAVEDYALADIEESLLVWFRAQAIAAAGHAVAHHVA